VQHLKKQPMKIKNYFSILLFTAFSLLITSLSNAQIADSIKYENGFLHYHEYGSKNLPAVIILTGGPGNSYKQLEGLAETISPKFRSILFEQRGTGKSIPIPLDSTTINLKTVTKDLKTLMDSLYLKKAIVIGHSWGGMLAMNFSAIFPKSVEHLILIAPGTYKDIENSLQIFSANKTHTLSIDELLRRRKLNKMINKNEADSMGIVESKKLSRRPYIYANPIPDSLYIKINVESNAKTAVVLMNDVRKNYDVSNSLDNYKGKIDIISGRQDPLNFLSYELKIDRPDANLHWINKCGHFPMYEQPKEFYDILFRVLNVQ
jgi:pimeloyl-ACP methyl ester carboxylesterase